jgi:hypothetical protein
VIEAQCPGTPPNNFPRQLAKNRVSDNVGAVREAILQQLSRDPARSGQYGANNEASKARNPDR